jgi:hypothetical protein
MAASAGLGSLTLAFLSRDIPASHPAGATDPAWRLQYRHWTLTVALFVGVAGFAVVAGSASRPGQASLVDRARDAADVLLVAASLALAVGTEPLGPLLRWAAADRSAIVRGPAWWQLLATAAGAAAGMLECLGHRTGAVNYLGIAASLVTILAGTAITRRRAHEAWLGSPAGRAWRWGDRLGGIAPLVLRAVAPEVPALRLLAGLLQIAGALLLRLALIQPEANRTGKAPTDDGIAAAGDPIAGTGNGEGGEREGRERAGGREGAGEPGPTDAGGSRGERPAIDRRAVVWGLVVAAIGGPGLAAEPSIRDRVAAYIHDYQRALRFVVADEVYTQVVRDASGKDTAARVMRGEVFLAHLPADRAWMAVHDVREVDGRAVDGAEDLAGLLRSGNVTPVARRLAARNAAFNLGSIARNFNEPTLPLALFDATRLPNLAVDVRRMGDSTATVVLAYRERGRPTLVRSRAGSAARASGAFVVDEQTGRIARTTFALDVDGIRAVLDTTYAFDARLALWVPDVFRERYEGRVAGRAEVVECEARYSNYRRFEVVGRIR